MILMPRACVATIIEKDGDILLTKRNVSPYKGSWVIPGGKIDENEKAAAAASRETKEETSIDIEPRFLFYHDEFTPDVAEGFSRHNLVLVFHAQTEQEAKINSESTEFRWVSPEDALKMDLGFRHGDIIKRWLAL